MLHPTTARTSNRPIRWALRMLRDPSLVDGASVAPRGGRTEDADRARTIAWLLCSRSG